MARVVLELEFALKQQESSKSPVPNTLSCDVDDIHPSNNQKVALSSYVDDIQPSNDNKVSSAKLTMASTDLQNLKLCPKEQTNSKVINVEPSYGTKDMRNSTKHKPSRPRPWDAFWHRVKPSGYNESVPSGNPAGYDSTETAQKDKQIFNMEPAAVPAIPLRELKDFTDNFSDKGLISQGSNESVYLGVLKSGQAAAIKQLDTSEMPDKEFLTQTNQSKAQQYS